MHVALRRQALGDLQAVDGLLYLLHEFVDAGRFVG